MKCQEVSLLVEEYFDGELETEQSELVAAHLAACAPCALSYEALQREQDFLLRYERDVEVTPQLWRGVEARIAAAQERETAPAFGARLRTWLANSLTVPRFSPALTAALVLVAVALTVGAMKLMSKHERETMAQVQTPTPVPTATNVKQNTVPPAPSVAPTQPEPAVVDANANSTPPPEPKKREEKRDRMLTPNNGARIEEAKLDTPVVKHEPTPEDLVKDAEAKYQKAIEILQRDVNRRRPQIDQQTLARYDETLNAIDRTINETRKAALGQGNDPVAVQYMLTAYAKKVEVLREMARN